MTVELKSNLCNIFVAAEQTTDQLYEEIQKSHVVCVVYAVDDEETLNRVSSHWLPLIREACEQDHRKPVVLVGNKTDLIDYSTIHVNIDTILNIFMPLAIFIFDFHFSPYWRLQKTFQKSIVV